MDERIDQIVDRLMRLREIDKAILGKEEVSHDPTQDQPE